MRPSSASSERASAMKAFCPHALRNYWAEHFDGDLMDLKAISGRPRARTEDLLRVKEPHQRDGVRPR
jgi:hypothetical protein